ncbi:hypothetical protein JTE90_025509 [Oedothorax gibbosus]|uniref:MIF4G domain-containing protein n=1 Tax=Oedothorax gibbosus TaxID=931172 RepID=A0AAV6TV39_9ARAC|nr:hypothetical protein JTE90_025509 [Oedothorax gibbosus]
MDKPSCNDDQIRNQGKKVSNKNEMLVSTHTQDIKLHQAENAWVPSRKLKVHAKESPEEMERNTLKRNVQSLLNKLTFQKFKILLGHLKKLNICTETEMVLVVDLIYENAVHEPHFSSVYANLCKHLEKLKIPIDENSKEEIEFSSILLAKCQNQFEEHCKYQEDKVHFAQCDLNELPENTENLQIIQEDGNSNKSDFVTSECNKSKKRHLGNIRLIGELFKLNMILRPVLQECIEILLLKQSEESLECLCLLLKTVGKELENYGKSSEEKEIEEYFTRIQMIVDENLTSTRIKCLLKDILDLKNNNWIPRRVENTPKTIDEIHKEAALEARKQWQWYQNMMYIAAQSNSQRHAAAHSDNNTCPYEGKGKKSSFKNARKDQGPSNTEESKTFEEAKNILTAQEWLKCVFFGSNRMLSI